MTADFQLVDWIVRPQRRIIERGDSSVHIKTKPMSVLECLVAGNGEPVSRNELFDKVWPGGEVSDDTLTKCVVELRGAFGDSAKESRVIETIPKLGFRLVLPVEPLEEQPLAATLSPAQSGNFRNGQWPEPRLTGLLFLVVVLALASLLFFDGPRSWLTDADTASAPEGETSLAPYYIQQKPGIAVLPFVNMSSDSGNEYFSDGISEEILNALANTNRIPVIARTSSFKFKGQTRDIKEIGRLLGVTHALEGSVRRADGRVRVTVQLIDTTSGAHVWSDVYEREFAHIFALQNEITQDIVDQISAAIGDEVIALPGKLPAAESLTARHTPNLEAYDLYLKGMQLLATLNPLPVEQAADYFDRAIAIDGNYADAWAAKGRALQLLGVENYGHPYIPAAVYPAAMAAYRRALEIDPRHAFAMGWLGELLMRNDFKWAEGLQMIRQSLALNPNDPALLSMYGIYLEKMHIEGSAEVLDRAFRLDPTGLVPVVVRSNHLARAGRWLDAATMMETSLIGDREGYVPNSYSAMFNLAAAVAINRRAEKATAADEQTRNARLDAAERQISVARRVALPVDGNLDLSEINIGLIRTRAPVTWPKLLEHAKSERVERLMHAALFDPEIDEKTLVAAYDIAIEQRHAEVPGHLFGLKPRRMSEADWRQMKDITGVTQYQLRQ